MINTYEHKIDAKGRLFIPSTIREEIGEIFYVTISDENCLNVFSGESWSRFLEKNKERSIKEQRKFRMLFSNAAKCELDSQGRFPLPHRLRDRVGLKKDVTIVGLGTFLQLWEPETYRAIAEQEAKPEHIAEVLEELDF